MKNASLDRFLPPMAVKSETNIAVEEPCSKCGRKIPFIEPKYRLRIKGEESVYCYECAHTILPKPAPKEDEQT